MGGEISVVKKEKQETDIESKILFIRGHHVMIDRDLAGFYNVETKVLKSSGKT